MAELDGLHGEHSIPGYTLLPLGPQSQDQAKTPKAKGSPCFITSYPRQARAPFLQDTGGCPARCPQNPFSSWQAQRWALPFSETGIAFQNPPSTCVNITSLTETASQEGRGERKTNTFACWYTRPSARYRPRQWSPSRFKE